MDYESTSPPPTHTHTYTPAHTHTHTAGGRRLLEEQLRSYTENTENEEEEFLEEEEVLQVDLSPKLSPDVIP